MCGAKARFGTVRVTLWLVKVALWYGKSGALVGQNGTLLWSKWRFKFDQIQSSNLM
jgi:hypothetical protein